MLNKSVTNDYVLYDYVGGMRWKQSLCHGQKKVSWKRFMRVNVQLGKYTKNENMYIFMAC